MGTMCLKSGFSVLLAGTVAVFNLGPVRNHILGVALIPLMDQVVSIVILNISQNTIHDSTRDVVRRLLIFDQKVSEMTDFTNSRLCFLIDVIYQ